MEKRILIALILLTSCNRHKEQTFKQVSSLDSLKSVGQTWVNSIDMEFAFIPTGKFEMGSTISDFEMPIHKKAVREFAMAATEVTIEHFSFFLSDIKSIDSTFVTPGNDFPFLFSKEKWRLREGLNTREPMVWVTQKGAQAFCQWLSKKEGLSYRLPSEAEWEYACKANTKTHFYFGDKISSEVANFNGNLISDFGIRSDFRGKTLPVKSFRPNQWGLYDMHGNVWEFCEDFWHESFIGSPENESPWMSNGDTLRCVIKGGSWFSDDREVRSSVRFGESITESNAAWGFRVALELKR